MSSLDGPKTVPPFLSRVSKKVSKQQLREMASFQAILADIWCKFIAFSIFLAILPHTEGGLLSTKPDRSDQLELLEFHKEAFCGQQQIRDGLESYISSILRNEQQGVRIIIPNEF